MPYVDALRPWGSDFTLNPDGSLALIFDGPGSVVATQQRVVRLIQMVPLIRDDFGNVIAAPDDQFNPTYGAGIRPLIGQNPTNALLAGVRARILAGLAQDPYILSVPPPVVTVTSIQNQAMLIVNVQCMAMTGQPVTIPTQRISLLAA